MRFVALALFGVAAALASAFGAVGHAAAPVPKHLMKEPDSDKAKLRGPWKVQGLRHGGHDLLAAIGKFEMVMEFDGDLCTTTITAGGSPPRATMTVTYDTAKRQLRSTNVRSFDADGKPAGEQPDQVSGYALDGDKLTLTTASGRTPGDPLKPGPDDIVITLTRVKK